MVSGGLGRVGRLAAATAILMVGVAGCSAAKTSSSGGGSGGGGLAAGSTISFGQTLPETGPAAQYAPSAAGVAAYFDYVNSQGGVNGHKLKITSLDDQYQPPVSVQLTRQLVSQDNIFAEVAPNGSAAVKADLTVLDPANVPVIGPTTAADFLYTTPPPKNVFMVWPAYRLEGALLANYATKTLHLNKIGVFYQNDSFGKSLLSGFESTGAKPAITAPYDPSQTDFSPQATQMKSAGVDGIVIFAVPGPATAFLNSLAAVNFLPPRLISQTGVAPETFKAAPQGFPGSYVGSFIPSVPGSTNPQVVLFDKEMAKYQPNAPTNTFAGWGWEAAQVAVAGLKAIHGQITRGAYEKALETVKGLQILGGTLSYSSSSHSGLMKEEVVKAQNGQFVNASPGG